MRRRSNALAALALVVLLAVSPVLLSTGAIGLTGATQAAGNASGDDSDDYTLDELRQDGPRPAGADPGVRMTDSRMFWVIYWPASNPTANPGEDKKWQYLKPSTTVGRNNVFLRTVAFDDKREVVKLVYWEQGERTVKQGNTTTTKQVPVNVTEDTVVVDLERGQPTVKIPLKQHDEPVHVTMWVEGVPDARWTFKHHSVATQSSIAIDTWNDYLWRATTDFFLWILLGGFVAGVLAKKGIDRAGRGPGYGYGPWIVGLTILSGFAIAALYTSLAELVVVLPQFMAAYIVGVFFVILLETLSVRESKALFLQPQLEHTTGPSGDDAYDIISTEAEEHTLVRMPEGGLAVVRNGLLAFLARVFGRAAYLKTVTPRVRSDGRVRRSTRIEMEDSKWDELFLVDPEAEQVVDHTAEGWSFELPPLDREHAPKYLPAVGIIAVFGGVAYTMPSVALPAVGAGAVLLAAWAATPVDGAAEYVPAPVHFREAYGTIVRQIEGYDAANTIEEATGQLQKERIRKESKVEQEIEQRDHSMIREMMLEGEIPATIQSADGEDDVEQKRRDRSAANGHRDPEEGQDDE